MIDLPAPDTTPAAERKSLREKRELEDFSEDHYLADLMEPELTQRECIAHTAEWDTLQKDEIEFTEVEVDLLKELPNKEYLLEAEDTRRLYLNLVDILYASCYNHRTTKGENTVESSWTINKLSSTLCWFQVGSDERPKPSKTETRNQFLSRSLRFVDLLSGLHFHGRSRDRMLPKIALLSLIQKLGAFHEGFRRREEGCRIRSVLIDRHRRYDADTVRKSFFVLL